MRTASLYEGAYLLAKGYKLSGKEKKGSKTILIFEDMKGIEDESVRFYNGGKVIAKDYADAYRTIKDYMFG